MKKILLLLLLCIVTFTGCKNHPKINQQKVRSAASALGVKASALTEKELGSSLAKAISILLPNFRQVVEHWLQRQSEHADNPERALVLAKSEGARCPFGFLDKRAA